MKRDNSQAATPLWGVVIGTVSSNARSSVAVPSWFARMTSMKEVQ